MFPRVPGQEPMPSKKHLTSFFNVFLDLGVGHMTDNETHTARFIIRLYLLSVTNYRREK